VPTVLTHPAVPLALAVAVGPRRIGARLLGAGVVASMLPDADVVGHHLGIPYVHDLGHRGLTHSLAFAVALALVAALAARPLRAPRGVAFLFVLAACASHGLLDMLTNGGEGIALFWPLSSERHFLPWRPLDVAPLSVRQFLAEPAAVLASELRWIWLPALALAAAGWLSGRLRGPIEPV
jgi:inner membrane protein